MKTLTVSSIITPLKELIVDSLINIEKNTSLMLESLAKDKTGLERFCLDAINQNIRIAKEDSVPACQDTGISMFFADIGQKLILQGNIEDAINQSVRLAYVEGNCRMSIADPLSRKNTGDNTPAVIYYSFVKGDKLKITFLAKGAGSENMSKLYTLDPHAGEEAIINCVLDSVLQAGAKPCPPIVLGVGIGGDVSFASVLAKRALIRPTGEKNPDERIACLEQKILSKVNSLKIGVQGLGGDNTALSVSCLTAPTHIAMLPVAVSIQCYAVRHGSIEF